MNALNEIYRTNWLEALGAWVAVSALTKAEDERAGSSLMRVQTIGGVGAATDDIHRHSLKLTAVAALCLFSFGAQANPMGGQVVSGNASFNTSGNTLTVTNTPGAIIHWQDLSIQQNEVTRFAQQSASSAVLNRVVGGNTSQLLGSLQSNGRVFLVNPNGIVFGQGATVDVAGLVATSLNLSDADFLAGRHRFGSDPNAQAVRNAGKISAQQGGEIWLIAPDVENSGVINAPNGEILLAAGASVELTNSLDPNLRVTITAPAGDATNVGQLVASAGRLGLFGTVVRNSGNVSADSATLQGGKIVFRSSQRTEVGGTVSASGITGGDVAVLGNEVGVMDGAVISADGVQGGGAVLVGGDYQGKNPDVQNAQVTYVAPTARISADAVVAGDGGKVVVWADDTTRVYGSISVRGGEQGGNGGFVETSGKRSLDTRAKVDVGTQSGVAGVWLLDPADITITSTGTGTLTGGVFDPAGASGTISWSTIEGGLAGGNVTIQTSAGTGGMGDIIADDGYTFANAGAGILTLNADRDIILNSSGTPLSGNPIGLALMAGNQVVINNSISLNGNIDIGASTGNISINKSVATTGNIVANAGGDILPSSLDGGTTYGQFSGNSVTLNATAGVIGSNSYGFATEVMASSLILNAFNGIGTGGKMFAANVDGAIQFANTNNAVNIYNASAGMARSITGTNTNGPVRLDSFDSTYTTTLGNITSGGTLLLRMNNLTTGTGAVINAGANTVYINPYTISPVPTISIGGVDIFNLTGGDISKITAGKIVIGTDSFGNYAPTVNIATGVPVTITNAANLEIWGTGAINIGANGLSNSGGTVKLISDSMTINGAVNAGGGSVMLGPWTPANNIDLGAKAGLANTLELSTNELNNIIAGYLSVNTAGTGNINISAAIAPTSVPLLSLRTQSGGITQVAAGTISVANLAVGAGASGVLLDTASNSVTNIAGAVTNGGNFFFKSGVINIGSNIDGLSGISITGFTAGPPYTSGVISLIAGGGLLQYPGALLSGAAVYAQGSRVILAEANPTGVIAGRSTGLATGDIFRYTSTNPIFVTDLTAVGGAAGVQAMGTVDANTVVLSAGGGGISQDAPILAAGGKGLSLTTTGPINLANGGNSIGSLTTTAVSGLTFTNHPLAFVLTVNGVVTTSNGSVQIQTGGDLTLAGSVNAGTGAVTLIGDKLLLGATTVTGGQVLLQAIAGDTGLVSQAAGGLVNASTDLSVVADNISFGGEMWGGCGGGGGCVSIRPFISGRPIELAGAATTPGTLSITASDLSRINPAASGITGGSFMVGDSLSGAITFKGNYSDPGGMFTNLYGASSVTQAVGTSISGSLATSVLGDVSLTEPTNQIAVFTNSGIASSASINVVSSAPTLELFSFVRATPGNISVTNTSGNIYVSGTVQAPAINLQGANGIVLAAGASLTALGTGDALVMNAGGTGFINQGTLALSAPQGRWLIYAADPMSVTKGGLTSGFRQYNTSYGGTILDSIQNGFIYASPPAILGVSTVLTSGTASHVFGATPTAVFGYSISNPSAADSEDLALITGTPIFTPAISSTTPAGSYTVAYSSGLASAAGYTFTPSLTLGYVVDPAVVILTPATVKANDISKTYGTTYIFTGTEFTPTGLVNGDTISSVTLTSAGAVASANVGPYPIVASNAVFSVGSASNYILTYADGVMTVIPATLNVVANIQSKMYGNQDPALTYQVSGLLFTDTLTGSLARTAGEDVGNYLINQGTLAASPNYVIAYTGGNLNISPRDITVQADAGNKVFGDVDPVLTFKVGGNGLASWDSEAVVFSGGLERDIGENVGPYAINQGTLAANANYKISSFIGNVFDITRLDLVLASVMANDASKTYGSSYSFTGAEFIPVNLVAGDTISSVTLTSDGAIATANAGSYPIIPSNAVFSTGSALNYNITYVPGTLTVNPAPLTIAAQSDSKVYDGTGISAVSPIVLAGLQNNDTVSNLIQRFDSRNALGVDGSVLNVTGYVINDGNGGKNYSVQLLSAKGTISPLAVTLSAPAGVSRSYNGTATYTPTLADRWLWENQLAFGDTVSAASLSYDDKNVASGKVINFNSVSINDSNGGNNYAVALQNGSGSITPASLIVRALPASKAMGEADPNTFGYTVTNLFDPIATVLSGNLARVSGEMVGGYPIISGSLTLLDTQNYSLSYVPGLFSILVPPSVQQITQTSVSNGTSQDDDDEDENTDGKQVVAQANNVNNQGGSLDNLPVCR
jgi:filamentous hemagglutinin family protein